METLILEDFRCFAGRNEVPMRPLTLLVGENSTGKTSFLAAVRAAHDLRAMRLPDFNEDPFRFGSYAQIANDRDDTAESFMIGQEFTATQLDGPAEAIQVEVRFHSSAAQPAITSISVCRGDYKVVYEQGSDDANLSFQVGQRVVKQQPDDMMFGSGFPPPFDTGIQVVLLQWMAVVLGQEFGALDGDWAELGEEHGPRFQEMVTELARFVGRRPYAFAPIQTRPQRTYDQRTEVRDPEGSHTPMMLQRLLGNGDSPDFQQRLEAFGVQSGLYSSLGVRKLGQLDSDPFQIEVKLPGNEGTRNFVDVGYGVSQAIQIIAGCVSSEPESTLLIQQPEVHLHPRAQAEMGSFFGQLAANGQNRLVVETHSDYLLDRVIIDVREKRISCSDVLILYFAQARRGAKIHPIELDSTGNLVNAPKGYRDFFLDEQRRFLGIA